MSELKTLKDIKPSDDFHRNKFSVREGYTELISKEDLRKEAIKRIKVRIKEHERLEGEGYGRQYLEELIEFLNITEEDLK